MGVKNFLICTLHQVLLEWSNQGRWDGWGNVICSMIAGGNWKQFALQHLHSTMEFEQLKFSLSELW